MRPSSYAHAMTVGATPPAKTAPKSAPSPLALLLIPAGAAAGWFVLHTVVAAVGGGLAGAVAYALMPGASPTPIKQASKSTKRVSTAINPGKPKTDLAGNPVYSPGTSSHDADSDSADAGDLSGMSPGGDEILTPI